MKPNLLVAALVAAGVIGTGDAAYRGQMDAPFAQAKASPAAVAGVAAPAANPAATSLPLNGFTELVAANGPAVVNVSVRGSTKVGVEMPEIPGLDPDSPLYDFFKGFGGRAPRGGQRGGGGGSVPMQGLGSGFIVSADGYILTNAHVVDHADEVMVRLTDRREYKAKVVGADKQSDVALIKIEAKGLPTVKIGDSRAAKVGEWVVAIGSPYGFDNSVSAGIVSAKGRSLPDSSYTPFIQTDVAVNPGNSGGPLFNLAGEVIGINSQIYSRSGGYQGISFAIPIEVAMKVKDQLARTGHVNRGRLGLAVRPLTREERGQNNGRGGLVVEQVSGAAERAGVQPGDLVLALNGTPVQSVEQLREQAAKSGKHVALLVQRNDRQLFVPIELG